MNVKTTLRLLCCLLAAVLLLCTFAACGDTPSDDPKDPEQPSTDTPSDDPDPEKIDYIDQVPDAYFGGNTKYTILCRENKDYEMATGDDSAALVDRAVYARNKRVEEEFGVQIEIYPVAGTWGAQKTYISTLEQSVAAGDNAYQLSAAYLAYNTNISVNGHYYDLRELKSINLDAPWWSSSFNESATVYGKQFISTGDLSLTMWEGFYAIFFNKKLATDYGLSNLYDMVRADAWTLEELTEITAGMYSDDGDDRQGPEDVYGLLINRHAMRVFITTCALPICERTADGGYELVFLDADHVDKVDMVYTALYNLIYENDGTYDSSGPADGDYSEMIDIFTAGRSLFMMGTLDNAPTLRKSDVELGILPFPKYDLEQNRYYAHSYDGMSSFGIPTSASDPEMCAKILDAMSAENKTSVIPAYNDIVLAGRVAQDGDSREMLSLLRENLYFDFGFIFTDTLKGSTGLTGGPFQHFGDELRHKTASYIAPFRSVEDVYKTTLEEILTKFQ